MFFYRHTLKFRSLFTWRRIFVRQYISVPVLAFFVCPCEWVGARHASGKLNPQDRLECSRWWLLLKIDRNFQGLDYCWRSIGIFKVVIAEDRLQFPRFRSLLKIDWNFQAWLGNCWRSIEMFFYRHTLKFRSLFTWRRFFVRQYISVLPFLFVLVSGWVPDMHLANWIPMIDWNVQGGCYCSRSIGIFKV
jgi:hypothetical protein